MGSGKQAHPETKRLYGREKRVAEQITPVRKLMEARRKLSDLLSKLDGNDKLDEMLQDVISNTESLEKLVKEAGVKKQEEGTNKE